MKGRRETLGTRFQPQYGFSNIESFFNRNYEVLLQHQLLIPFSHNLKFSFFHIFKRVLARSFSSFRLKVWLIERKAALKWVCVIARTSTKWPGKTLLFCFLRLFWKFSMQVTITLFFLFAEQFFSWHFRIVCFASAEVTNAWIGVSQDSRNGKRIVLL